MTETVEKTAHGAMLFDRQVIREMSEDRFTAAGWLHAEPVTAALRAAGRGNTLYVGNVPKQFVLRHYLRGGLAGRITRDRYLWAGEERTRPFLEWRLLAKMADRGLRVPRPAAARYVQKGPFYTADIITVRIPHVLPLSEHISKVALAADFWAGLGRSVQEFHAQGVFHADMNAYNLQVDKDGDLWMLDFDRGRLLPPGTWQQKTLSRLHRSLEKIVTLDPSLPFRQRNWDEFLEGYFDAARSA